MNANEIIIDDDFCSWNGSRTIFFQCSCTDKIFGEITRCGADSMHIISFKTASGTEITKHCCDRHTNEFIQDANKKNFKIIDMRG